MKKTLYIYAGMPRTGSQTIMTFLHRNENFLFSNYNLYIPKHERHDSYKDTFVLHNIQHFFSGKAHALDALIAELQNFPQSDYLLSNNTIVWTRLERKHFDTFRKNFPDHDIKFVLYVRRLDHFLRSRYFQGCAYANVDWGKADYQKTIEHLKTKSPQQVYPTKLIEEYQSFVGTENVIVKLYDRKRFVGKTLIDDFLECFGIVLSQDIDKNQHIDNEIHVGAFSSQIKKQLLPYLALGLLPDSIEQKDARAIYKIPVNVFKLDHTLNDEIEFENSLRSEIDKLEQFVPGYRELFAKEELNIKFPGVEVEPYRLLTTSLLYHILHGQGQLRQEIRKLYSLLHQQKQ